MDTGCKIKSGATSAKNKLFNKSRINVNYSGKTTYNIIS
jgi:hypothetical protein